MIKFEQVSDEIPFKVFKNNYDEALKNKQKNIEAICISSYSKNRNEVNARFVNLKLIKDKKFIFFSNYNSPKAQDFLTHNQITASIYWHNTNVQIRMKAIIEKTSPELNQAYFEKRDKRKMLYLYLHTSLIILSPMRMFKKTTKKLLNLKIF